MAKQPWQQTKTKTESDYRKEKERKMKRKKEEMEREAISIRGKRYKRIAFLTFILGFGAFLFKGTEMDTSTGGVLTMLSVVGVLLSGVFFIAYGRVSSGESKFYQIFGGAVLGLGVIAAIITLL